MSRLKLTILTMLGAGLLPMVAKAQPITHLYFGLAGSESTFEQSAVQASYSYLGGVEAFDLTSSNDEDGGWHLTYGYQFRKHWAVEAQIFDGGKYKMVGSHQVADQYLGYYTLGVLDAGGNVVEGDAVDVFASYDGYSVSTVHQQGLSVLGVGILPVTRWLYLKAKLGFGLVSSTSEVKIIDQFPDVLLLGSYEFDPVTGDPVIADVLFPGGESKRSGTATDTSIPLIYGLEASLRWQRDWDISLFWQVFSEVDGGFFGDSADLETMGVQVTFHY
ncbi:hypothetical protein [Halioxenophilus sp. WMMB6]|uniref:hypothetical protein n=1 Tax=Halioxenophilus sp. WMMB6 TaxID=3073815 RepID=UPI00295E5356|nr:hypothetical protein [Halioxenophilus sp. WMMB6]